MATIVKLNNREIELKYDFNAMCAIEEKTGKGIQALIGEDIAAYSLCRVLLWAGIRHLNPMLSLELVGTWIHEEIKKGATIADFSEMYSKALIESGIFTLENENENEEKDMGEIVPVNS